MPAPTSLPIDAVADQVDGVELPDPVVLAPSLHAVLARVADPRKRRGVHRLVVVTATAVCAVAAGAQSFLAVAEWVADLRVDVAAALAVAWTTPTSLARLALTDAERAGDYTRIQPAGLLQAPAFAPFLRGIEPYGGLVAAVREVVADPAAVLEFSYDWRLPVTHNAALLHTAAAEHLAAWQTHPRYEDLLRALPDTRPARLVLIAHSMGGLLIRALAPGLDIRATITLGTPFDGAAKAALILNSGRGAPVPLPRTTLRDLAATLPGLHELLPTYRCLDDLDHRNGDCHDGEPRRLTPSDVAALGGPEPGRRGGGHAHRHGRQLAARALRHDRHEAAHPGHADPARRRRRRPPPTPSGSAAACSTATPTA
ncbi:transposase family protein [Pseudonocardia humida]|uniref:Transposase family protein n=1 Tax=Pseudonocardia humida TaxID=2800819 RepID=A0ABT1ABU8_9PSEU|nr:transposase family protein [Pseudonocardia humida]MCO1660526.1 transposase family protein [Pseudonocardia humida]